MKVRRLNSVGLAEFSSYIDKLSKGVSSNLPVYLLDDDRTSDDISFQVIVENKKFISRYEMGVYLCELLSDENLQSYIGDAGFWSWFALFWFDQLCSKDTAGNFKPSRVYNYVLSESYYHRPRHAVYITWQLVQRYGEDARFLLCKAMNVRGELTEQLMGRQGILSSRGVMELASELYFDYEAGNFKKGATSRKSAGCVTRYVAWLQQLELTYDLYSISKADLLEILPTEFKRFRT